MISGIKHIIFDLGGVLLNLDYDATERAFVDLGFRDFGRHFSQLRQDSTFDGWETGRLSREEFIRALQAAAGVPLTEAQIVAAWNAMLLDFPLRRLQLLQQIRLHYDLILLSNTNEIHEEAFNQILRSSHGIPGLAVFFDRIYYSHRIGQRKPDRKVFERILNDCGFRPSQTLFIDDSPQHVEAAKSLGIQTIWLEPGMTIEDNVFRRKVKSR